METGLFQLADQYFLCHQELVAHLSYADMVSIKNEPFIIKSSVVGGKGFRTISEQLVPYLMRYSGENCIHYFFSPQAAAKLTLPVMPAVDLHRHHYLNSLVSWTASLISAWNILINDIIRENFAC